MAKKNMDTKSLVIGFIAMVGLAFGVYGVMHNPSQTPAQPTQEFGAIPGTSSKGPDICVAGVCHTYMAQSFAASTTPCNFQVTSTSSVMEFVANVTTGSTTAITLTLATSSVLNASTSLLYQWPVGTGAGTFAYHPTSSPVAVLGPGKVLTLSASGGAGTSGLAGVCQVELMRNQIN